jgi:hypothetical protein
MSRADGGSSTLRICQASGMTSLFEPDENILRHFPMFSEWGRVVKEVGLATHRLDDIAEIDAIDYLKIDVQGSELAIFQNGHTRLRKTLVIQTEVLFLAMYKGQPLFGDIDVELRKLGFSPCTAFITWLPGTRLKADAQNRYLEIIKNVAA